MTRNETLTVEEAKEKVTEFMDGLEALSRRTGVYVGGCGCCGSPYLCVDGANKLWEFEDIYVYDDEGWAVTFADSSGDKFHMEHWSNMTRER